MITFAKSAFALLSNVFIKDCYESYTCTALQVEKTRLPCIDTQDLKG